MNARVSPMQVLHYCPGFRGCERFQLADHPTSPARVWRSFLLTSKQTTGDQRPPKGVAAQTTGESANPWQSGTREKQPAKREGSHSKTRQ